MNPGGCKRPRTGVALEPAKVVYFLMMKRFGEILPLGVVLVVCWSGPLFADFTLILKNGRRITVQSYREEGGMIKFYGLGGEIGIAKDQIQSILKAGEIEGRGMVLPGTQGPAVGSRETGQEEKKVAGAPGEGDSAVGAKKEVPTEAKESTLTPEERLAAERAKEEKEYQRKVKEITEQLKSARDRLLLTTRGSSGSGPTLLNSEEAIRGRTEVLTSRQRDAQHNPEDPAAVKLLTPSPFTGAPPTVTEFRSGQEQLGPRVNTPPPAYTEKERELSNVRNQVRELENARERLIEEMRQKKLDTGSLFLE